MVAKWRSLHDDSQWLWALDCLQYVGARVAIQWCKTQKQVCWAEPDGDMSDEDEDDGDSLKPPTEPDHQTGQTSPEELGQRRLTNLRQQLRQAVKWMEAELHYTTLKKTQQRCSKKRRARISQPRKMWPRARLTPSLLRGRLKKYKNYIRIKSREAVKRCRARQQETTSIRAPHSVHTRGS